MRCPDCENDVPEGNNACRGCGYLFEEAESVRSDAAVGQANSTTEVPATEPESVEVATVVEEQPAPTPRPGPIEVATFAHHVCGPVKENDQDYCHVEVIDYPLHGYRVVLATGADGIGGQTGGERWAAATVNLFLGAVGAYMPTFDSESEFVRRDQFWDLLNTRLSKHLFPVINWVTGCVHSFGSQVLGTIKFGNTWVVAATVCDLRTGRVNLYTYSVGDSSMFLIQRNNIEKLTTEHVNPRGELERYVGKGPSADGKLLNREFQLDAETLPFLALLLCSDGLTNMVGPEETARVARKRSPKRAVHTLIHKALNCKVPYGRQSQSPDTQVPITPGDDNVFVGIITMKSTKENDYEETA